MAGPLKGVKVLDLSRILAGPWATQVLADFGADVIKVERPTVGDDTRHWGPPYMKKTVDDMNGDAAYFMAANRGKQSVTIDITKPEGQTLIGELVTQSDILVENFKVGGLKRYGLDYASLEKINPSLIYCSITGFGQTGPYASKAGYDAVIQAMGGLMSVTGESDELSGGGPQKVGVAVSDLMTGMYAVSAITAALYHRERTGVGQYIDLALLDTQVAGLANQNMNFLIGKQVPNRQGSSHPNIVPYQTMESNDGFFVLAVGNDDQFRRMCKVINRPELASDIRYATNQQRVNHRNELIKILSAIFRQGKTQQWITLMESQQIPCAPINTIEQVFADSQVQSRNMEFELKHGLSGRVKQVANPVKFSKSKIEYELAPPLLGEHTEEILEMLGHDQQLITKLKQQKII